jgi:hypothetical protein
VTGDSVTTNYYDFVTLKYAPDGTLLWSASYNSAVGNSGDFTRALALDDSGNAYVLGSSDNQSGPPTRLKLVKYGPGGNQIWAVAYLEGEESQPVALLVRSNAIYVAGNHYGTNSGVDYITLKYDLNGTVLWAQRYAGVAQSQETVSGIALDPSGNVVVTGNSYSGTNTFATVKYDPNGTAIWTNIAIAPPGASYGEAKAVAADASGNIYIAGHISTSGVDPDYLLLKLGANGQQLWSATYAGPNNATDRVWTMALDPAGNVLITGATSSSLTMLDYLTAKFDPNGNRLWAARYSGTGTFSEDNTSAIKTDSEGNAYVTGYSAAGGGAFAFATIKYDPNGNQLWAARYNAANGFDAAADLALDGQGNVFVTGLSTDPVTGPNIVTVKYHQVPVAGLPQITNPPQSLEVIAGTNATFEVTATGDVPLHYQWRFMGAPLQDETNRTLTLVNLTTAQAGDYSVIVSNAAGATVSPEARLTVFEPPSIPTAWTGLLVTVGGRAFVPASAMGDPPLFFQWQFNGTDLPGETNNYLLLFNLGTNNAGSYSLVVTNLYGRAEKILATIAVRQPDTLDRWYWRHPLPLGNDLLDVAYGNGRFVAVGQDGTILVSSDGVTWTNRSVDWNNLLAVTFGNGLFVAVGYFGGLLTSPDGEHWTKPMVPNPYPRDLLDVTFGNGRFVAVGAGVVWSADGVHWQEWVDGRSYYLSTVGYGNGKFVAYPNYPDIMLTSTDGENWSTNVVQPFGLPMASVTFGNGLFVAANGSFGISISADGFNWTNRFSGYFENVAFGNGIFLATGEGIARSTDALTWNRVLPIQTNFLEGAAYGNGSFVVVGGNGMILTSPDGISWTQRGGGTPNNFRGIARAPAGFVAVGNQGAVWASADGFAWTNRGSITTNNLRAIAFGADTLVTVGDEGAIFTSSNGVVWTARSATTVSLYGMHYGNGQFIAVGDGGTILVSSNGANWVAATSGTASRLQGITFGKGLYVATGRSGTILTSSNALVWNTRPSPTSEYLESVVASSNIFVAVGHSGAIVASLDGITWGRQDSGIFWDIESVVYGDGIFVAVGDRGRVITSPTSGDWLSRFTGCSTGLRHVIYADGAFWAAGNNETILKSGQTRPFLLARGGGNEFDLLIQAEIGKAHRLQTSSNLVNWTDLFNFTPSEELTTYNDAPSDRPQQFYRVVSP